MNAESNSHKAELATNVKQLTGETQALSDWLQYLKVFEK